MKDRPSREDYWRATIAGWCWLAAWIIGLLCSCSAKGAEPYFPRQVQGYVCRITNQHRGASDLGSGTLIDKTANGREGLVLTCAHLFRDGVGEILVSFAGGKSHHAKLIARDDQADLAALAIGFPSGEPAVVAHEIGEQMTLHACGYGPRGIYRCAVGRPVGQAASAGQLSLLIGDAVRSGDSGGGVFDEHGRLVAVIWGEAQGVTYASYGQPLSKFLNRVLGRRAEVVFSCPDGTCPRQPRVLQRPISSPAPQQKVPTAYETRCNELQRQIDQLNLQKQDRGNYLTRSELPDLGSFARREEVQRLDSEASSRHTSLLEQLETLRGGSLGHAAGTAAVGLLGLSGPAGWAVVAGASLGGWLIGRRVKRKLRRGAGGRHHRRFQR